MTLQVVIHGIPLQVRRGSVGRWGWLGRVRALWARHVLGLESRQWRSSPPHSTSLAEQAEDLGWWVGAVRVRQVPESVTRDQPSAAVANVPLLPAVDLMALREGRKVQQIFAQNQIRSPSARPPLRSIPRSAPRTERVTSHRIAG